jgi:hypothetical protein
MYRLTPIGLLDENWQPVADDNPAYLAWLSEGNSPEDLTGPTLETATQLALIEKARQAGINLRALPGWADYTYPEAAAAMAAIFNGWDKAQARAAIDAQFAGVNSLATLGAATVASLKVIADALIDERDMGLVNLAKVAVFLRDMAIK